VEWTNQLEFQTPAQLVSTFTAEAENVGECQASKEVKFLVQALKEVGYEGQDTRPATILADHQTAIKMASNPVNQPRAKHIDVAYHFV
jgi:hypothetical protein